MTEGCASTCIKWILFVFNFVICICGLAVLVAGIVIHVKANEYADILAEHTTFPSVSLIVIGSIVFIIAFFGCCGAIRESHCMIITFACIVMTILLVQVGIAVFAFVSLNKPEKYDIETAYQGAFNDYWTKLPNREFIDICQSNFKCCGVHSYSDFQQNRAHFNGTIPWSCCDNKEGASCSVTQQNFHKGGCIEPIKEFLAKMGNILGGVALGVVGVEIVGIIFALCLSNSIKNAERRHHRV